MKVLAEATGVVPLPPAEVMARLEERLSGGPYQMRFEVDRKRGMVAVQGGWWYRGEYYVSGDPAGTRVTHRVVNAAEWGRWAVPLANRFFIGFRDRVSAGFAGLVEELGGVAGPGTGAYGG
ncbi:MAG TPA: hypothetical protein VJX66_09115 [Amycolatopsis sp.]|nr:hypothetical protein [Amycolatopsis sp.]